jgi:transcriptional regulator
VYIPEANRETRPEVLHRIIRENSFATLVTGGGGELVASHLPFLLEPERGAQGTLVGHMARANGQWQSFREGEEVLAIFQGAHAYISPSWYAAEMSVPTWNYVAVHAYGVPRLIEESAALRRLLAALVPVYEAGLPKPWSLDGLPEEFVERLARAIVGFEIPITRLEGKLKLSQNRSREDRESVVAALREYGDAGGIAVAALMAGVDGPGGQ